MIRIFEIDRNEIQSENGTIFGRMLSDLELRLSPRFSFFLIYLVRTFVIREKKISLIQSPVWRPESMKFKITNMCVDQICRCSLLAPAQLDQQKAFAAWISMVQVCLIILNIDKSVRIWKCVFLSKKYLLKL